LASRELPTNDYIDPNLQQIFVAELIRKQKGLRAANKWMQYGLAMLAIYAYTSIFAVFMAAELVELKAVPAQSPDISEQFVRSIAAYFGMSLRAFLINFFYIGFIALYAWATFLAPKKDFDEDRPVA
jgi:hypothetical protein